MKNEFSLAGYAELIESFRRSGYTVTDFYSVEPARPHLVLRHDIDMTPACAARVAEVEARLGAKACYFVLLRSEIYNVFSEESSAALSTILGLGHEIGLHFDASLYASAGRAELDRACRRECAILEAWLGRPVGIVSFHRPAQAFLGLADPIAGRPHTYQPRYFRDMAYCSDSRGGWHHGHPLQHACVRTGSAIQLLTHPIWWDTEGDDSAVGRLDRFVAVRDEKLRSELARNCKPYADALAERRKS